MGVVCGGVLLLGTSRPFPAPTAILPEHRPRGSAGRGPALSPSEPAASRLPRPGAVPARLSPPHRREAQAPDGVPRAACGLPGREPLPGDSLPVREAEGRAPGRGRRWRWAGVPAGGHRRAPGWPSRCCVASLRLCGTCSARVGLQGSSLLWLWLSSGSCGRAVEHGRAPHSLTDARRSPRRWARRSYSLSAGVRRVLIGVPQPVSAPRGGGLPLCLCSSPRTARAHDRFLLRLAAESRLG